MADSFVPTNYTKNGQIRTARTRIEAVELEFDGWKPVGAAPPLPPTLADRVAALENAMGGGGGLTYIELDPDGVPVVVDGTLSTGNYIAFDPDSVPVVVTQEV